MGWERTWLPWSTNWAGTSPTFRWQTTPAVTNLNNGQIPWGAALMALDKAGYAGSLGLEYKPTMPQAAASVEFTASVLREAVKRQTN